MAGWQEYVDTQLVGSGKLVKALIASVDGQVWARSAGWNVTDAELQALLKAYRDPSRIRESGLFLAGTKYLALKCDERSIYGREGVKGAVCVKTARCVIVSIYGDKTQPGDAASTVERFADYLIASGW